MGKIYVCDVFPDKVDARDLLGAAYHYSKEFGNKWIRFTVNEKDKGWDSLKLYGYVYDEVPISLKNTLSYFKKVQTGGDWQLIPIYTREFDRLTLAKMREICKYLKLNISFPTPCKEMILDVLDNHIEKVRLYLKKESISQDLGSFDYQWFYSGGQKKDITLSLTSKSPKRTIDVTKKGIIETLLEELDRLELENDILTEKVDAVGKDLLELEKKYKKVRKDLKDNEDTLEIFGKAGEFYWQEVESDPGETIIELSLDDPEPCSKQINVTEEGFVVQLLKSNHNLTKRVKTMKQVSSSAKKKEKLAQDKITELTLTLEKIHTSFEISERENDKLREENEDLTRSLTLTRADLTMSRSEEAFLRNELVISKIVSDDTPKPENTVDSFFLTVTDPDFECY